MATAGRNPWGSRASRLHSSSRRDKSRPRPPPPRAASDDDGDGDDGVHGERMKPLASCCLNSSNNAVPRKPLAPLECGGGGNMDLLLLALDSCSSGQKRDSSREGDGDGDGAEQRKNTQREGKENRLPSVQAVQAVSRKRKLENNTNNVAGVPMFAKAAVNVASRWLELLHLDLKGRLAALKRSRRNVRGVIVSGHIGRDEHWLRMFHNMDSTLAAEGSKLESNIRKVMEMQRYCVADDMQNVAARVHHSTQQQGGVAASNSEIQIDDRAVAACTEAICSTAAFALK